MKVLIMGLPNSGKTFLAKKIAEILKVPNINADALRQMCNDWEFSEAGRVRQSERMAMIANYENQNNNYTIAGNCGPCWLFSSTRRDHHRRCFWLNGLWC